MPQHTIKPIGTDVLVAPLPKRSVSETGRIHIPQAYQDDSKQWIILAVGPKVAETEIKVGVKCLIDPGTMGVRHIEDGSGRMLVRADRIQMVWL